MTKNLCNMWLKICEICVHSFQPLTSTKVYVRNYKTFFAKRTQIPKSQMNVNKVLTKDYDKMDTWSIGKNEPKTNPNEPKFKKAKMNVTSIITKAYENKTPIRAPKKQTQTSKRQKPMQTSLTQSIMKKTALSGSDKTKPIKPNACPLRRLADLSAISVTGQRQKMLLRLMVGINS